MTGAWDRLKRQAPRVPEETCPRIDRLTELVGAIGDDLGMIREQLQTSRSRIVRDLTDDLMTVEQSLASLRLQLEDLRAENQALRASGRYWYGVAKKTASE